MKCNQMQATLGCRLDSAGVPLGAVIIHTEYRKNAAGNIIVHATRYTDSANVPITLGVGEVVVAGECKPASAALWPLGANYASGTFAASHDPDANGAVWSGVTFGYLQSVTITVLRAGATPASPNRVEVTFPTPGAAKLYLTQGETKTWSVAQDGENIAEALVGIDIEAVGNTAFNVVWIQQ